MKKLLALLLALCLLLPAGLAAAETVFPLSEGKITFRIATWQRSGQVDYCPTVPLWSAATPCSPRMTCPTPSIAPSSA